MACEISKFMPIPKVNVITKLEFELAYCGVAVHHVSCCTTPSVTCQQKMIKTKSKKRKFAPEFKIKNM